MLEIKRSALPSPGALSIFGFTPKQAGLLSTVTIQGQGFSSVASENIVRFNGVAATVVSASPNALVVEVPAGVSMGSISIRVGGNTTTSTSEFSPLPIPVITSISPDKVTSGATVSDFTVTGFNLSEATFEFLPAFVPPALSISGVTVEPDGTAAQFDIAVASSASGKYALTATNELGSSTGFLTDGNTLLVGQPREIVMPSFSMLNSTAPDTGAEPSAKETTGDLISILNALSPEKLVTGTREVTGLLFSIFNGTVTLSLSQQPTAERVQSSDAQAPRARLDLADPSTFGPDSDGDGIPDSLESLIFTDPHRADTDGDGYPDGLEIALKFDPLVPNERQVVEAPPFAYGQILSISNLAVLRSQPVP